MLNGMGTLRVWCGGGWGWVWWSQEGQCGREFQCREEEAADSGDLDFMTSKSDKANAKTRTR